MEKIECHECTPAHVPAYLQFAARQFGATSSAANGRYLRWLYEENPFGGRLTDSLLAVTSAGDVVGCVQSLNVPWRINDERVIVPAVHNLMVSPEHRQGIGTRMVMKSLQKTSPCVIPSAIEPLGSLYRRLGCARVESRWYRRVLRPFQVGWQLGAQKLWGESGNAAARHFP